jgi:hypothetical protein
MDDRSLMDRFGLHFLATLVAVALIWQLIGWWNRAPAVEYDNLKYIQLLSTAVSSRKIEMVGKVEIAIRHRHAESEMSDKELAHFEQILKTVRAGQWEEADRMTYDFAAAQLSRKRLTPDSHAGHDHTH